MSIEPIKLPYALDALEPHISKEAMDYHYNKHHKGYADKLNKSLHKQYDGLNLEKIIKKSFEYEDEGIFNNASQVLNHDLFWQSMSPKGGGKPQGALLKAIEEDADYQSFDKFKKLFVESAADVFGSGWVFLVLLDGNIEILSGSNAENPLMFDGCWSKNVLLAFDVWEHAYYLDYKNSRAKFIEVFLDKLVNWKFAEERYNELIR